MAYLDSSRYRSREGNSTTWKEKWVWDKWVAPTGKKLKEMVALVMREQVKMMV